MRPFRLTWLNIFLSKDPLVLILSTVVANSFNGGNDVTRDEYLDEARGEAGASFQAFGAGIARILFHACK